MLLLCTVIMGMHGISSLSFLYHFIVFVQLEDKRHPKRGRIVRSKFFVMMSYHRSAGYSNLSNWYGHFGWF